MFSETTSYISDDYDVVIANSPHSLYNFPNIAERHFAEQLTRMDRVCNYILLSYSLLISFQVVIFFLGCIKRNGCSSMPRCSLV